MVPPSIRLPQAFFELGWLSVWLRAPLLCPSYPHSRACFSSCISPLGCWTHVEILHTPSTVRTTLRVAGLSRSLSRDSALHGRRWMVHGWALRRVHPLSKLMWAVHLETPPSPPPRLLPPTHPGKLARCATRPESTIREPCCFYNQLPRLGRGIRSPIYAGVNNSQGSFSLHHTSLPVPRYVSHKQIAYVL